MTLKSAIVKNKVSRVSGLDWKPLAYMTRAVKWLLSHGGAALFLDPGLGKTSITLKALAVLLEEGVAERVLVVAPLRVVYSVWPREIEKWAAFNHIRYAILHGKHKNDALHSDAQVFLINPEGLEWFLANWKDVKPDTLVIDESTKFKNSQSKRFKLLKPFLGKFKRRWILTGTPATNGLLDLFGQMYIVDEGRALGRYITHYRNTYFDASGYGGYDWRVRKGSEKLIYNQLKPYTLRLQAEDYLELPDMVENDIGIDLPANARKMYDQMEDEAFAAIDEDRVLDAANAAAAVSKCRQIVNGGVYDGNGKVIEIHNAKLEALESIIEERGGRPVLVAYEFVHDYLRACTYFKTKFPVIGGGVTPAKADALVNSWNNGGLPVLFVHPKSAGHGLNMQGCDTADCIVWFTPPYDLEDYDQLNRRLRRQGSKIKTLFIHRLVGLMTVDNAALRALSGKTRTQKALLDALRTYRKARISAKV